MEEKRCTLSLWERKELKMDGVSEVLTFLDNRAEIQTTMGRMQITGMNLHLERLDLDAGEVTITGRIDSVYYPDEVADEKRGIFSRFFS